MRWPNYNFFKPFRSDSTVIQLNKVYMLDVISVHFKLNTITFPTFINMRTMNMWSTNTSTDFMTSLIKDFNQVGFALTSRAKKIVDCIYMLSPHAVA